MLTGDSTTDAHKIGGEGDRTFVRDPTALEEARSEIVSFIRRTVTRAGARGVVVGMSGGIDSTLSAALAVQALGSDRVLGLGLPAKKTDGPHVNEARTMAEGLGVEFREISLRPMLDLFEDTVAPTIEPDADKRVVGNVVARLRMICAYYAANARSYLVLGTANRSELLLGYFTKYGDGGADLYPLGDLYKTEVRALAHQIGLPRRIVGKEATAGLWTGQTDADDIGAPYDEIDPLLNRLVDRGERVETAAEAVGVDVDTAGEIAEMYVDSLHKRDVPPTPGIADRSGERAAYPLHLADWASDP